MHSLFRLNLSGAPGQGIGTGETKKRREFSPESLILRPCAYCHRETGRSATLSTQCPYPEEFLANLHSRAQTKQPSSLGAAIPIIPIQETA
jgi:hypothetical protein